MKALLLDNIRSMQNVGALFRNADGAGFEKMYLTGYTPTPPRNDISKTALGAEKTVDWEYFEDALGCMQGLREQGFSIYSVECSPEAISYTELYQNTPENIVLVLGNELQGVNSSILADSDQIVMIPMLGNKESLNVSVAGGIVMYATVPNTF